MDTIFWGMTINYIDIAIISIIIIFAVIGRKAGFIKMIFRIFSFLAAIFLAKILYKPLANFLFSTRYYTDLLNRIINRGNSGSSVIPGAPKAINGVVSNVLASHIAETVINIIAFVAVLIIVKIILIIAEKLLKFFTSLPVIGFINKSAGLLLGAAEGVIIVFIVLIIMYAFSPIRENPIIDKALSEKCLTSVLYKNNPLTDLILPDNTGESEQSDQ